MKLVAAVTFASIYALSVRVLFGFFHGVMEVMSLTFLMFVPAVIGYLTVRLMPPKSVRSKVAAFFIPWLTALVILIVTILLSIEGTICWVMIFPIFAILSGFGGLLAYSHLKRQVSDDGELLDNDLSNNSNKLSLSFAFFIPILLGYLEGDSSLTPETLTVTEVIVVDADVDSIWSHMMRTESADTVYTESTVSRVLDFPRHLTTTLDSAAVGGKRMTYYERGLYFEEIIKEYDKGKKLVLEVNTDPLKIPPTVMDEHILIGGRHLDILEDTYELEELKDGTVKISLSSKFYINTPFNWYSEWWANYLLSDALEHELLKLKHHVSE